MRTFFNKFDFEPTSNFLFSQICFLFIFSLLFPFFQSNFPHFRKEQLIDFERRFLLKISFQIIPQTTPSAFLRYLLNLWPAPVCSLANNPLSNKKRKFSEDTFRSPDGSRGNSIFTDYTPITVLPVIPYKDILVIADILMGLFWEGN